MITKTSGLLKVKRLQTVTRKTVISLLALSATLFTACSPRNTSLLPVHIPDKSVVLSPKQQEDKESLIEKAKKQGMLTNLEDARESYLKALKIDPACDACYYEMAMLYYRAGYLINAINLSRTAYQIDSTNVWYKRQLAQLTFMGNNFAEAEKLYTSLLKESPESPDLYYSLASVYENKRDYKKALAIYDTALVRFGFNENVTVRKQEIFSALGEHTQAIDEAQRLVDYNPEDPRFYTLLGDGYAQAMNDSMAVVSYNSALTADPNFPPALLGKAEIARKAGDFNEYFRNIMLYCKNDKIDDKSKVEYLSLVLRLPSFSEHFKTNIDSLFTVLHDKHPNAAELKYLHSSYYMQTARPDAAIGLLTDMLKTDSTNYATWTQMLSIEYSLMHWDALKINSDKAINLFADHPNLYMYRGVALWQLKELDAAVADFERAKKFSKKDVQFTTQINLFLGDLYHEMGKDKKAFESYEEVLKVDSLNAIVLNNYAYFMAIKGKNLKRAYEMSKKAIEIEPNSDTFLDTFGWILYLQGKLTEARVIFRQAIAAGGKNSAVILDHYADVLNALGEYDTASIYWNQALEKPDCENKEEITKKLLKLIKK